MCNKIYTNENMKIQDFSKLSFKIDVWKTSRAQRLHNYYGLKKNRVGPGTLRPGNTYVLGCFLGRKCSPKGGLWNPRKSQRGPKIIIFNIKLCFL